MDTSSCDFVAFVVDGQSYALDLRAVPRVLPMFDPVPLPGAPPIAAGVINVGGQVVPVLDIRKGQGRRPEYRLSDRLVLVQTSRRLLALAVDDVLGVVQVEAGGIAGRKVLDAGDGGVVAGAVALREGILYITDLESFLKSAAGEQLEEAVSRISP